LATGFRRNFFAVQAVSPRTTHPATAAHAATTTGPAGRGLATGNLRFNGNLFVILRDYPGDIGILHSWIKALASGLIQRPGTSEISAGRQHCHCERRHHTGY